MNAPRHIQGPIGAGRKQYILSLLRKFKQSGLSRRSFAESEGISINTLDSWRKRFKGASLPDDSNANITFVEARPPITENQTVEISLAGGRTLRVSDSISRESLRHIIDALES